MFGGYEMFNYKTGPGNGRPLPELLSDYQMRTGTKLIVVLQKGILDERVCQNSTEK